MVTIKTEDKMEIERSYREEYKKIKVTLDRMFTFMEVWTQKEYQKIEEIIEKQRTLERLLNNACKH